MAEQSKFAEFVTKADINWRTGAYRHQRRGQNWFNTLRNLHPNLAREIVGTEADPFYDDNKVELFLDWVHQSLDQLDYENTSFNLNDPMRQEQ